MKNILLILFAIVCSAADAQNNVPLAQLPKLQQDSIANGDFFPLVHRGRYYAVTMGSTDSVIGHSAVVAVNGVSTQHDTLVLDGNLIYPQTTVGLNQNSQLLLLGDTVNGTFLGLGNETPQTGHTGTALIKCNYLVEQFADTAIIKGHFLTVNTGGVTWTDTAVAGALMVTGNTYTHNNPQLHLSPANHNATLQVIDTAGPHPFYSSVSAGGFNSLPNAVYASLTLQTDSAFVRNSNPQKNATIYCATDTSLHKSYNKLQATKIYGTNQYPSTIYQDGQQTYIQINSYGNLYTFTFDSTGFNLTDTSGKVFYVDAFGNGNFTGNLKAALPVYANDAAAGAGGLTTGQFYQTIVSGDAMVKVKE
jgi:hypothetical protein